MAATIGWKDDDFVVKQTFAATLVTAKPWQHHFDKHAKVAVLFRHFVWFNEEFRGRPRGF
ncbi:hypothetical protein CBM2633_P230012 [Cupriavidus taiwanensis]|uniref:Uncharacterized protein n=2 Tax=Cupriavidus TaxID=106589 RepID=A0A375CRB8_9BURK|nr:hypothetical protein CBM2592_P260012 [Cupriavidus taiwanensis]SOZ40524.1 hypothetical protein CBM2605_P230010 [Cupriavidus neocaledonicus]SOY75179.1 hypothetical protein CBM2588_P250010 [Cupriavidus taiwanensis]SOY75197.1 hypothetical protein CBM2585_P230011 [Cupriavidus taiwanensis]SOY75851.1 hypothetical protein CBM2589_P230011 [Cupriavidus taiwanensis]